MIVNDKYIAGSTFQAGDNNLLIAQPKTTQLNTEI